MRLTVHFAAVANAVDTHDANFVGDFINHPVVTYTDAPIVLASRQLATTGRAWGCSQRSNRRNDAVVNPGGGRERSFSAARSSRTRYMVTCGSVRPGSLPAGDNQAPCDGRV
jgi:hypothetical protein